MAGVLSAQMARYLVFTQDLSSVLQHLDRIGSEHRDSDTVVLSSLLASSIARALGGRPRAALEEVAQAEEILQRIPDAFPTAATQLGVTKGLALLLRGDAHAALAAVQAPYARAAESEVAHDALGSLAAMLGHVLLLSGRPRHARSVLEEAVEELVVRDQLGLLPLSLAGLAEAASLVDDPDTCDRALDRLSQLPERLQRYYGSFVERSRGLALHYRGDIAEGTESVRAAARRARIAGRHAASVLALLDMARVGEIAEAHEALEGVAAQGEEPWLVEHARVFASGARDGKHEVLASVGRQFAERGFELIGAEALARAACAAEGAGARSAAFTYTVACDRLVGDCEVETAVTRARPEVLTEREREIADRVAAGRSNSEIAAELVLSARTIESHLGRIYKRLDIDGREALSALTAVNGP
ncbi:MAG: helix-turn-helix transcriptional regulator [Thermoleophilia bacterium]|nr:helix-turn-helix transcriptional regulator [Thermoleophilia bacterium]